MDYRWPYQSYVEPPPAAYDTPAETVTIDKWFQPASVPVRRRVFRQGESAAPPLDTSAGGPPDLHKWYMPLSVPTRRRRRPEGFYIKPPLNEGPALEEGDPLCVHVDDELVWTCVASDALAWTATVSDTAC